MENRLVLSLAVVVTFLAVLPLESAPAAPRPVITGVNDRTVRVRVPKGFHQVTLEGRPRRARNGAAWTPKLTAQIDGRGGIVKFVLNAAPREEELRVTGNRAESPADALYDGDTTFLKLAPSAGGGSGGLLLQPAAADGSKESTTPSSSSISIQESDIWQIRDARLYFFNQFRGLQIFDLSDPDDPALIGSLRMAAVGEEMYLLGASHAALLKQGYGLWQNGEALSEVAIVEVSATPRVVASLPVNGYTIESRLIGQRLYVVSQDSGWQNGKWENASVVTAFDLTDPAHPQALGTLRIPGYGNVVTATDQFLFVAATDPTNWRQSIVSVIDPGSQAAGGMQLAGTIRTAGIVGDKFKLHVHQGVLTAISQVWGPNGGRASTKLENFALAPLQAKPIAALELAVGESPRGTRFAGAVGYVSTFFQIDPLWVLDLADPLKPKVSGHLEVPGFSSFIQPLADGRLVTFGRLDASTAVALFDVRDPAKPVTLSQLTLGDGWSYSEADYNEKAFNVLADEKLILVPFAGFGADGYASQVQLIDLQAASLVKRGTIAHSLSPRRATVFKNRIVAISGTDLLSVDATDRNQPVVKADLAISWPVDRVFLAGDHLLEIANGHSWSQTEPTVTVSPAADPDIALAEIPLGDSPVVGADLREGKLFVAQAGGASNGGGIYTLTVKTVSSPVKPSFVFSIYDVSELPAVRLLGRTASDLDLGWSPQLVPIWVGERTLVWVRTGLGGSWGGPILFETAASEPRLAAGASIARPFWNDSPERLLAFDVSNPAAPRLVSEVTLGGSRLPKATDQRLSWFGRGSNWSAPFVAGTQIYVSHEDTLHYEVLEPLSTTDAQGALVVREDAQIRPMPRLVTGSFLEVIDYADPAKPVIHDAVNIPGELKGLGETGALLYTAGDAPLASAGLVAPAWSYSLQASAFDGTKARLIARQPIASYPGPIAFSNGVFFVTSTDYSGHTTTAALQTWALGGDDAFHLLDEGALQNGVSSLRLFGGLLAIQNWSGGLELFDVTDPAALTAIGFHNPNAGWWANLDQADGRLELGLWLPLGDYGVQMIQLGR